MSKINLLTWREELRAEKTRQLVSMLGMFAFLALAIVAIVHVNHSGQISHQQFRNGLLTKEIALLYLALKVIPCLDSTNGD